MLVSIEDDDAQLKLYREIVDKGLSVRQVEQLVREYRKRLDDAETADEDAANDAAEAVAAPSRDALQIEQFTGSLRDLLSTQVSIRHKESGSGKIEITYYSQDDLERVLDVLLDR
jgi:ParB family chromosome partitioning protein